MPPQGVLASMRSVRNRHGGYAAEEEPIENRRRPGRPAWRDPAATTKKVMRTLEEAARDRADLLAFPETCDTADVGTHTLTCRTPTQTTGEPKVTTNMRGPADAPSALTPRPDNVATRPGFWLAPSTGHEHPDTRLIALRASRWLWAFVALYDDAVAVTSWR